MRSAKELTSPIFNIPPKQQVYPAWLEGRWAAKSEFVGFEFPTLPRQQVMQQEDVPGFKKCSIIDFADVGKSPLESHANTFSQSLSHLRYNITFLRTETGRATLERHSSYSRYRSLEQSNMNDWASEACWRRAMNIMNQEPQEFLFGLKSFLNMS